MIPSNMIFSFSGRSGAEDRNISATMNKLFYIVFYANAKAASSLSCFSRENMA